MVDDGLVLDKASSLDVSVSANAIGTPPTVTVSQGSFVPAAQTPGQVAIANALGTVSSNPAAATLIGTLNLAVQNGQGAAALQQLGPMQVVSQAPTTLFSNTAFQNQSQGARLDTVRAGYTGGMDWSGFNLAGGNDPLMGQLAGRLYAYNPVNPAVMSDAAQSLQATPAEQFNRWGTFVTGNAVLADQGAVGSQSAFHTTTVDVTAGADYRIDRQWAVGFLGGYGHTSATLDGFGSRADIDSYRFGPYVGFGSGPWYANGHASFGFNQEDAKRAIPFLGATAASNPDSTQFGIGADGGYQIHSGHLAWGPIGGAQYTHLWVDGYSERGAGAADLVTGTQNADSFLTQLGGKASYDLRWKWNNSVLQPQASATWQHEWMNDARNVSSAFDVPGSGSFVTRTTDSERESAILGAGVNDLFSGGSMLFLSYEAQLQDNYTAQSITGGLRIQF